MNRLLSSDVSATEYTSSLQRLLLLHQQIIAAISPHWEMLAHPQLHPEQLLDGLHADLAALASIDPPSSGVRVADVDRPVCAMLLADAWEALGAWYVLEGAALGGEIIARKLRENLGPDLPLAHFSGRGRERWPRFARHLEALLTPEVSDSDEAGDKVSDKNRRLPKAVEGARRAYVLCTEVLVPRESAPAISFCR
jgi:heme oxygenase